MATLSSKPTRLQNRWSGNSGGIFLGFSPFYEPQIAGSDRFNTGSLRTFEGGAELKRHGLLSMSLGLRYSQGTIPSLETYDPAAYTTTYLPNASLTILGLGVGVNIPLNEPYNGLGPVQLFVPLDFSSDLITAAGGAYNFRAVTFDTSFGLGARLYTKSLVRADLLALYHLAIPLGTFTGGSADAPDAVVLDSAGETMKAGLSGFELRLGLTFILPDAPHANGSRGGTSQEPQP